MVFKGVYARISDQCQMTGRTLCMDFSSGVSGFYGNEIEFGYIK